MNGIGLFQQALPAYLLSYRSDRVDQRNVEESENNVRLARRPEEPPVGRPQTPAPIRKLHKRAHLRKEEQAKRKPTLDIPDCAQDERDTCACPTCEDWMHTECISNVCPRDGTDLERNDV
ncbi:hypothetical protein RB195_005877 [Necator americanus]|uniref:Uncharacterized protein n=1 Tax=Necator americanus TaxID=51031 RepID=A0ABR1BTU4_NECAM